MKTVIKISAFVLLMMYGFIGFTIFSPLLSFATKNPSILSVGLLFSLLLFLVTLIASRGVTAEWRGIFSRLEDDEVAESWLIIHSLFTFIIANVYPWITVLSSMTPLFSATYVEFFPIVFLFSWVILLFSILGLWCLHVCIGMGYRWFCRGTVLGVQSYSNFALQHLRNKKQKGIEYLLKALLLLKDYLEQEELEHEELNKTIIATRCSLQFQSDIPYDKLHKLASEVKKFPTLEHLPRVLSNFNRSKKVQWTEGFGIKQKRKRTALEVAVTIAAVLSGLTFLPETARNALFEILQSLGSSENVQVIMGGFLMVVTFHISSLTESYRLSPFEVTHTRNSEQN